MSSFKSQVERDIHAVFLNPEEFGGRGELAGHENIQMTVETLMLEMPPSGSDQRVDVSYEGMTVYVSASDVPDELLAGRKTTFRGEEWFVLSSDCNYGLKTVRLYRERA